MPAMRGYGSFKVFVDVLCSADEADGRRSGPPMLSRGTCGFYDPRIGSKIEMIIGAQVKHSPACSLCR